VVTATGGFTFAFLLRIAKVFSVGAIRGQCQTSLVLISRSRFTPGRRLTANNHMLKTLIIATVLLPTLAFAQRFQQLPQPVLSNSPRIRTLSPYESLTQPPRTITLLRSTTRRQESPTKNTHERYYRCHGNLGLTITVERDMDNKYGRQSCIGLPIYDAIVEPDKRDGARKREQSPTQFTPSCGAA
jgi:hypothetical protein